MKKYLLLLLVVLPLMTSAQETINWMTMTEAQEAMKKEPRKLMIDVYTSWCGPCKMMMNTTFKDPAVISYLNANFYAVKFNAEGTDPITYKGTTFSNPDYDPAKRGRNSTHQFAGIAQEQGRLSYPTLLFLNEDQDVLTRVVGVQQADFLIVVLNWFGTNTYMSQAFDLYKAEWEAE